MPWLVKNDKDFEWIGKWATQQVAERGLQWMLVGFESPSGAMPVEGGQVVVDGRSSGRVTSVRRSAELGKVIGLAIVPHELAVDGGRFDVQVNGRPGADDRPPRAVLRSGGREGEIVSGLAFLSVDAAADRGGAHPVAKSAIERAQRDLGATFEERDGWLVPVSIPGEESPCRRRDRRPLASDEARAAPGGRADRGRGHRLVPDLAQACARPLRSRRSATPCAAQVGERFSLDVTGAYSVIAIVGPEADTVLRRMTHIHHFPSGGEIAHVQGHVLQRGGGYWVICAQELGQYVWDVAVDRASALGGGPVGVDALPGGAT